MKLKNREKYTQIIQAAVYMFTNKGFYQTTVAEIAREAGVGKGTVYTYFENKEALFLAIIEEGLQQITIKVEENRDPEADPRLQLKQAIMATLNFFAEHRDFCIFLVREHFSYDQSIKEQAEKLYYQPNSPFREILFQGREKGIFEFEHLDTLTAGLTGAIFSSAFYWFIFSSHFPVSKIYSTLENLFFHNLLGNGD